MRHRLSLVWFRRGLRLDDNRALREALSSSEQIVPVFVLDPRLLARPDTGERRVAFLQAGLAALDTELRARGSYLVLRSGDPLAELTRLRDETGATALYTGREYERYGRARDAQVQEQLGVEFNALPDHLLSEPEQIATKAGTPYTVFTPYFRVWQEQAFAAPLPAPERIPTPTGLATLPLPEVSSPLPAGEGAARTQLERFAQTALAHYDTDRDYPDLPGTSRLSAYLKLGMLSPRRALECARTLRPLVPLERRAGVDAWVRQLAWRDFYYQILTRFPHVETGSFKPTLDRIAWPDDPALFSAWQQGETGYPIVDAGMRELAQTGYIHNRARMIVASFLTKDLLCSWQLGERHFMQLLLDGDMALNNGGWQWAAGTGTDAQPYFRIFNPVSQGEKFDPDGAYVKRWCPELKRVPPKWVHKPWELSANEQAAVHCVLGRDYPTRIVEHSEQRSKALALYKAVSHDEQQ